MNHLLLKTRCNPRRLFSMSLFLFIYFFSFVYRLAVSFCLHPQNSKDDLVLVDSVKILLSSSIFIFSRNQDMLHKINYPNSSENRGDAYYNLLGFLIEFQKHLIQIHQFFDTVRQSFSRYSSISQNMIHSQITSLRFLSFNFRYIKK